MGYTPLYYSLDLAQVTIVYLANFYCLKQRNKSGINFSVRESNNMLLFLVMLTARLLFCSIAFFALTDQGKKEVPSRDEYPASQMALYTLRLFVNICDFFMINICYTYSLKVHTFYMHS